MGYLDDPQTYQQHDPSGMLQHLPAVPEQFQIAWQNALRFELPRHYTEVNKVVILGMGGSAIGGDLLRRLTLLENSLPVWVHRSYDVAPFIDETTLLIASSYSGNTEETITSFVESLPVPAKKLVLTGGGQLRVLAEQHGIPVFPINYQAPPRAAFAHSFVPLLGIFQKLGLLEDKSADFEETIRILNKLGEQLKNSVPLASNPAKQLATKLSGKLTVIYGAGLLSEVAQRWKAQLNENSKAWAFYELFPELNHNALVGYQFPPELKDKIMVVLLHSSLLHPRISGRYRPTAEILAKAGIGYELLEAEGDSPLAQMMGLLVLGDYVSFYLAMLSDVDPTPVASIDYLKKRLTQL